jgi:hypothetical protein
LAVSRRANYFKYPLTVAGSLSSERVPVVATIRDWFDVYAVTARRRIVLLDESKTKGKNTWPLDASR